MRVHVLGCHGPWPCANGATSGYLMEHEGKYILVDCGSGVLGKLMAICDPAKLEGILLSHLHFDQISRSDSAAGRRSLWRHSVSRLTPPIRRRV